MKKRLHSRQRPHEQGQTIIFVAISLVSLLAMAALAIDIVTLYAARSEIQRAADAAALAGAKAIADSGVTTLPTTDGNYGTAQTLAQTMAAASINAMISPPINQVAGGPPLLLSPPAFDFTTHPGSYQVTVNLKRSSLPTFFSKVWARSAASVTASATAEAYNPANLPTMTPIALKSVKPWLVANADPNNAGVQFIDPTTGALELGVGPNVIGQSLNLTADCQTGLGCNLIPGHNPPIANTGSHQVEYVPALVADNSKNVCPPCSGGSDFEQSIACADVNAYAALSCGSGATPTTWDNTVNPAPSGTDDSALGAECLIHASTFGQLKGQDTLDPTPWPANPMQIKSQSGLQNGKFVTTSNSIVAIPIIDTRVALPASGQPLVVVGYMQAFINGVQPGFAPASSPGDINVTVLNIAGCSSINNGATPVIGGSGSSPVPVRLITPP